MGQDQRLTSLVSLALGTGVLEGDRQDLVLASVLSLFAGCHAFEGAV